MSIKFTNDLLAKFIKSDKNEVLALTGSWGVGKTYVWNSALKKNKDEVPFDKYCYVSLFGISSMAELRTAIFAKSVSMKTFDVEPTFNEINNNWHQYVSNFLRNSSSVFKSLINSVPYGGSFSMAVETFAPYFIKNTLICFDDFERQNTLKIEDVLGLISELKEEKNCKIVLIFNSEKLNKLNEYQSYKEKVVDYEICYNPNIKEAFDLVFDDLDLYRNIIFEYVDRLEIKNVRILRKIKKIINEILSVANGLHELVVEDSIATAVFLCWITYAPDEKKPKLEEIDKWNSLLFPSMPEEQLEESLRNKVKRLKSYGFSHVSDLDISIAKIVEVGYVEATDFVKTAQRRSDVIRVREAAVPFDKVWTRYHGTLADDPESFITEFYDAAKGAIKTIGNTNLNSTVSILRQLDRADLAEQLIDLYINENSNDPSIFDLDEHPFGGSIDDSSIREKFEKKLRELIPNPSVEDSLRFMVKNNSYNAEHMTALKAASEDDFHIVFMAPPVDLELSKIIKWCMRWVGTENEEVTIKAAGALKRIKGINKLNEIRLARFGI